MLIPSNRPSQYQPLYLVMACLIISHASNVRAETVGKRSGQPEAVLPTVKVSSSRILRGQTERTTSYTSLINQTATPLSLSSRDTPQSVSVVTRQRIDDQNLNSITDVVNNAVGVSINQYETHRAQINARGFNLNSLMTDGVSTSWEQPWSSGEVLSSLAQYDRVEVVRGATGLTTGAGDPSAAINMVRKRASARQQQGNINLQFGSWNQLQGMLDIQGPLNAARTIRGRAVVEHSQSDSWIDMLSNQRQVLFGTIEADITPQTLLIVGANRQETKADSAMWGGLPVWYSDGSRTSWPRSKTTSADWVHWDNSLINAFAKIEHRLDNGWKLSGQYEHSQREEDSYLLYLFGTPDRNTGLGLVPIPGSYVVKSRQDDFNLQASRKFGWHGYEHEVAFGYTNSVQKTGQDSREASLPDGYLKSSFNQWTGYLPAPTWSAAAYYGKGSIEQSGLYGVARIQVTDPLKLIIGARLSDYKRTNEDIYSKPYELKVNKQVSPYAGLIYDFNPEYSWYVSYSDIFKPQNARDINGAYLDPILGKNIETGVKGEWFNGKLNGSAALFRITQDNLAQATGEKISGTTPPEDAYRASKGAVSNGFELELSGRLADGWNATAGYTQFNIKDADNQPLNTLYPRKLLRLFTTYQLPDQWNAWQIGGGLNWQSEIYTVAANPLEVKEQITQPSYALVELMAKYQYNPNWSAQLNIHNALDEHYFSLFPGFSQLTYGAPRGINLSLNYRF